MSVIVTHGRELYTKAKREMAVNALSQALNLLGHSSERNYQRLAWAFEKIANNEQQRMIAGWIKGWLAEGSPGALYLTRVLKGLHPNVRKNFVSKMIATLFFRHPELWTRFEAEHGFYSPSVVVISPTMKCNYRCVGCYAGEYSKSEDLAIEVFERVINEAKEIGVHFFVITGGEPFVYKPLLDIFEKHNDCAFQVYTNGSLIDEDTADKLVSLGNVSPQISIEGFREHTDERRGKGAFDRVMRAMDNLREKGALFAFSCTATSKNIDVITSDEFIDLMIEKGALYGWYFSYAPVGYKPDLTYMPTPEQRNQLRAAVHRMRKTKPILIGDFWNDGPLTGGCIAAGRIYLHINHKGDVEPCVFCHFAADNIKNTSLLQALKSPFFEGLRRMQPFNYNTLRPCPLIDHPKVMRTAVKRWGAYPTHEGAESLITELCDGLDSYAEGLANVYAPVWEKEYFWAAKWLTLMDFSEEKIEARKNGYYLPSKE